METPKSAFKSVTRSMTEKLAPDASSISDVLFKSDSVVKNERRHSELDSLKI